MRISLFLLTFRLYFLLLITCLGFFFILFSILFIRFEKAFYTNFTVVATRIRVNRTLSLFIYTILRYTPLPWPTPLTLPIFLLQSSNGKKRFLKILSVIEYTNTKYSVFFMSTCYEIRRLIYFPPSYPQIWFFFSFSFSNLINCCVFHNLICFVHFISSLFFIISFTMLQKLLRELLKLKTIPRNWVM